MAGPKIQVAPPSDYPDEANLNSQRTAETSVRESELECRESADTLHAGAQDYSISFHDH